MWFGGRRDRDGGLVGVGVGVLFGGRRGCGVVL